MTTPTQDMAQPLPQTDTDGVSTNITPEPQSTESSPSTAETAYKRIGDPVLLDKIDKLFACNVGEYIDLPQLVVLGDQSSGKSSVLEGLTRLPFPRDSGLCTKFATQITPQRRFRVNTPLKMDVCDAVLWGPFPAMPRANLQSRVSAPRLRLVARFSSNPAIVGHGSSFEDPEMDANAHAQKQGYFRHVLKAFSPSSSCQTATSSWCLASKLHPTSKMAIQGYGTRAPAGHSPEHYRRHRRQLAENGMVVSSPR
jgi:hypothetical protein